MSTAHGKVKSGMNAREAANYIADMILELRNIAKAEELVDLKQLLELSYYEAYTAASRIPIPEEELKRLEEMGEDARRAAVA